MDERIRQLCDEASRAGESDLPSIFEELNTLLKQHSAFVRYMAIKTFDRKSKTEWFPLPIPKVAKQ